MPVSVAWRAGYALHHLGHLGDALRVVGYADPGRAGEADWARLAGLRASTAWDPGMSVFRRPRGRWSRMWRPS